MVELLVVLAILSALMAFLLPALSQAQKFALASICASNQRSIFMSAAIYANDDRELRLPPMILPQNVLEVPRITQVANGVDRWNSSGGVGSNSMGAFNLQSNWAELMVATGYLDPRNLECRSDKATPPSYVLDAAATPGVATFKLSYGINTYLYTFKVDGWGGSCYSGAPTSSNIGGMGDKGYGFYGPRFDQAGGSTGIKTPEQTILFGDRLAFGDGPGISFGWFRLGQLDIVRHEEFLPLTFADGSTRTSSYQKIWGQWSSGGYRRGVNITNAANTDFWFAARRVTAPFLGINSGTDLGQRGPWPGANYYAINPNYKPSVPGITPGFYVLSLAMPYWQGWERQPFVPGMP